MKYTIAVSANVYLDRWIENVDAQEGSSRYQCTVTGFRFHVDENRYLSVELIGFRTKKDGSPYAIRRGIDSWDQVRDVRVDEAFEDAINEVNNDMGFRHSWDELVKTWNDWRKS